LANIWHFLKLDLETDGCLAVWQTGLTAKPPDYNSISKFDMQALIRQSDDLRFCHRHINSTGSPYDQRKESEMSADAENSNCST
jgi:hypothetical protein